MINLADHTGTLSYQSTTADVRKAERMILMAVGRQDVNGFTFPGEVALDALAAIASQEGIQVPELAQAVNNLLSENKIAIDQEEAVLRKPGRPEPTDMDDRGGYYPEVVPLTTMRTASNRGIMGDIHAADLEAEGGLPVGLGGTSEYDWDVFNRFAVQNGRIVVVESE